MRLIHLGIGEGGCHQGRVFCDDCDNECESALVQIDQASKPYLDKLCGSRIATGIHRAEAVQVRTHGSFSQDAQEAATRTSTSLQQIDVPGDQEGALQETSHVRAVRYCLWPTPLPISAINVTANTPHWRHRVSRLSPVPHARIQDSFMFMFLKV